MKAIFLLALLTVSCGTVDRAQSQIDKAQQQQEKQKEIDNSDKQQPDEQSTEKGSTTKVTVKTTVEVEVSDGAAFSVIFAGKEMSWEEAKSSAPEGYHLPNRSEMEQIYLDGKFDGVDGVFWTSEASQEKPNFAWLFSLDTRVYAENDQSFEMKAVYILD